MAAAPRFSPELDQAIARAECAESELREARAEIAELLEGQDRASVDALRSGKRIAEVSREVAALRAENQRLRAVRGAVQTLLDLSVAMGDEVLGSPGPLWSAAVVACRKDLIVNLREALGVAEGVS